MYKIVFSRKSIRNMESFVDYLEDYYDRFYSDTGIENEAIIRAEYQKNTRNLFDEIRTEIVSNIQKGVFGNILSDNDKYQELKLVVFVRSYIGIVALKKFKKENIVAIDEIMVRGGK